MVKKNDTDWFVVFEQTRVFLAFEKRILNSEIFVVFEKSISELALGWDLIPIALLPGSETSCRFLIFILPDHPDPQI